MAKYNNVEFTDENGLICDNSECDWADNTIKFDTYKEWIDSPCPKCGENVLTEQDYMNVEALRLSIEWVNSMPPEEVKKLAKLSKTEFKNTDFLKDAIGLEILDDNKNETLTFIVNTHKKINVTEIKPIKKKK